MLKFFRNIRRKLLETGRLKKYTVYALGEILLVVIGILIALQINNWNEDKKSNLHENKLKTDIYKAIDNSFSDFRISVNYTKKAINAIQIIEAHFEKNQVYHDSLNEHFHYSNVWAYQRLNHTAYETAKQYGLHFIKSDSLRALLSDLYEVHQNLILQFEKRQHDFHHSTVEPFLADNFERVGEKGNQLIPVDYTSLNSNKKYRYILKTNHSNRINELRWFNMQLEKMEKSKELLKSELK